MSEAHQAFAPASSGQASVAAPAPAAAAARDEHAATGPLLEVTDLVTHYPVRRGLSEAVTRRPRRWVHAVDGVSFSLQRGEMMALVGESGCGKTSTVQTILGMVKPTAGAVRLNGTDIAGLPETADAAVAAQGADDLPGPVRVTRPEVPGTADS